MPDGAPPRRIRVLIVEAGEKSDDIVCTLVETLLRSEDQVNYEAISYVWGDPRKTNHIICDGFHLGITANLLAALRDFGILIGLESYGLMQYASTKEIARRETRKSL